MRLNTLMDALRHPEAFPPPRAARVEVIQTHISVVFLVGDQVYKLKKPLDLGFVDCSTLEKRAHLCHEEVRLNRRLAPEVYRGVLPVTRDAEGRVAVGGSGEVVDHVVWMRRVPWEATLEHRLEQGQVSVGDVEALARRLAAFHEAAAQSAAIARGGSWETVAGNYRENFEQTRASVGDLVSEALFAEVEAHGERELRARRPLIEARAAAGAPRDTHGDLRLEHVYLFPEREPPGDIVIIDCVEFNARFRHADPVADLAFLGMELMARHHEGLAEALASAWFEAMGDPEGEALWTLYLSYRALVRAKVDGIRASEPEVPEADRLRARERARSRWLLAWSLLAPPARRPCLVLTAGLPAAGKSTLSRALASAAGFEVLRSDEIRKRLAGLDPLEDASEAWGEGIYAPQRSEATYDAMREQAREALLEGRRVLVDAGFRREHRRAPFIAMATALCVPVVLFVCRATPETTRARLAARDHDASDADWRVYQRAAARWQEPTAAPGVEVVTLSTEPDAPDALTAALARLRGRGVL